MSWISFSLSLFISRSPASEIVAGIILATVRTNNANRVKDRSFRGHENICFFANGLRTARHSHQSVFADPSPIPAHGISLEVAYYGGKIPAHYLSY
jgi:hypothetical protein